MTGNRQNVSLQHLVCAFSHVRGVRGSRHGLREDGTFELMELHVVYKYFQVLEK